MPQGSRAYTENDIMRMQQDAVARVREMQGRVRQSAQGPEDESASHMRGPYRNWSTNPNMQRQNRAPRRQAAQEEEAPSERREQRSPPPRSQARRQPPPPPEPELEFEPEREKETETETHVPPDQKPASTTLLQDILGAIGLDDDKVLILGLILILINDKADTTLILALAYLLL